MGLNFEMFKIKKIMFEAVPEDTLKNWNRTSWFLTTVIMDSGHYNILLADNDFNENMIIIKTCFTLLSHDMVQNNFTKTRIFIYN